MGAQSTPNLGPLGGNLDDPRHHPAHRRCELQPQIFSDDTLGLHKHQDTTRAGIKDEKPWHYMAAVMLLHGSTNGEIAKAAGVALVTVSGLRSQVWFQQRLAQLATESGKDLTGIFQSHALAAIERVATLAEFAEKENVKLAANLALIEHGCGKPVQRILSSSHTTHSSAAEEYESLSSQLAAIKRAREKTLPALPQNPT